MTWICVVLSVAGWVAALAILLVLPAAGRRRALQLSLRLRANLRPYLLRRAMDVGVDVSEPPETHDTEAIIDDLCEVTRKLVEHERSQMETGDTVDMATSNTMPLDTGELMDQEIDKD